MSHCRAAIKIYKQSRGVQAKAGQKQDECVIKEDECFKAKMKDPKDLCPLPDKSLSQEECEHRNQELPEDEECMPEEYRAGNARRRRVKWQVFNSKADSICLPKGDIGAQPANEKKREAAKGIFKLYRLIDEFFEALKRCPCRIDKCDFENCPKLVCKVREIHAIMVAISRVLAYSPYIHEITEIIHQLSEIINYIIEIPALIYVKLVDITFCIHEFGVLLQEVFLPIDFALVVQKIHSHLRKLKAYNVLKQIIYVPVEYDVIVSSYAKDPRLRRLEQWCNCKITVLRPDDPRARLCPVNHRTIEVEFDGKSGRQAGFAHLLNRCLTSKTSFHAIRSSTISVSHCNTMDKSRIIQPDEVELLSQRLSRTQLRAIESDIVGGTACAALCPEKTIIDLNRA
ncbi:hypothetical protein Aperf_G00000016943 [Anoplocephala perfoliata]